MAYINHKFVFTAQGASALPYGVAVRVNPSVADQVMAAASVNHDAIGITIATMPSYGAPVAVLVDGIGKAIAAASLGLGARVGVASTNGALGPLAAAGGSQGLGYSLGIALSAAPAGGVFTVLVDPRQIV